MDLREVPTAVHGRHPWETTRADFFTRLIVRELSRERPLEVADIGSGDAYLAEHLLERLPCGSVLTCVDSSYDDGWLGERQLSRGRVLRFARGTPPGHYDCVLMLDVLEHVPDDLGLLRDTVLPHLSHRGRVLASVPAWQLLFTNHDVKLGHVRRYSLRGLLRVLEAAGLTPLLAGGLFTSLLVPRALSKLVELVRGHRAVPRCGTLEPQVVTGAGSWSWGAMPTRVITGALRLDTELCLAAARRSVPIPGLSVWALAEQR